VGWWKARNLPDELHHCNATRIHSLLRSGATIKIGIALSMTCLPTTTAYSLSSTGARGCYFLSSGTL
jgi:hypothetical protein